MLSRIHLVVCFFFSPQLSLFWSLAALASLDMDQFSAITSSAQNPSPDPLIPIPPGLAIWSFYMI